MQEYIPTFTDISEWETKIYENTTGSRSKKIVVNPITEKEFFFKGSKELENGEIRYPMEFWSEIASSKIGQFLDFNILDYNIAFHKKSNQAMGCISASMVDDANNNLTEGIKYLTGYSPNYNPKTDEKDYTFQFILEALKCFKLDQYTSNFIEMLVFDALVGNSDRHQENWGFINYYQSSESHVAKGINNKSNTNNLFKPIKFLDKYFGSKEQKTQTNLRKIVFSPIYDSGCCLGREFTDEKVAKMLKDEQMQDRYLRKGTSEIRWQGIDGKLYHFELLKELSVGYTAEVKNVIERLKNRFDDKILANIILSLDNNIPLELQKHRLSDDRKKLMIKLVNLRYNKLASII